jgi:plasmid replication initiation protein
MKSLNDLQAVIQKRIDANQAKAAGKMQGQSALFTENSDTPLSPAELETAVPAPTKLQSPAGSEKRGRSKLLPARHIERDFFLCDVFDYALKDDGVSMEAPIFTLSTKPDLSIWRWESKDGSRQVTVTPSVQGRATQFDKDVLIYVVSQMTEALNRERSDAKNRIVRFTVYDYLVSTNKPTGGKEYARIELAMERLRGTSIKTNIKTGGQRVKEGFGLINRWKIIEKSPDDERMIAVEVELSEWLFNAVQAHEVLTIHPNYFRLRKPLERRLYELARKHCGHQATWSIGLELLQDKAGSKGSLREFRRMVREIIEADTLPDYRIALDEADKVIFYTKNMQRLTAGIAKRTN